MVYETFLETITEQLQNALGEEFEFTLRPLPKNNGVTLDGLTIQSPASPLAPTIYLNPYYQHHLQGLEIDAIVHDILELYRSTPLPSTVTIQDLDSFPDLEKKIMFRIIHSSSNQVLLSDVPHISYLDLSIIFFLALERTCAGQMTALIHNHHAARWQVSARELWSLAQKNTPLKYPAQIRTMTEMMTGYDWGAKDNSFSSGSFDLLLQDNANELPLYVMTNQSGLYGASCMLYQNVLRDFAARIQQDLIILPSSIHEILLTPDSPNASYEELSRMVTSINRQDVPLEDQLSNQVYRYTRCDDRIRIMSHGAERLQGQTLLS